MFFYLVPPFLLRMLMCESREVEFEDELRGQVISVQRDSPAYDEHFVCLEHASVHEVQCDESRGTAITYEYVY